MKKYLFLFAFLAASLNAQEMKYWGHGGVLGQDSMSTAILQVDSIMEYTSGHTIEVADTINDHEGVTTPNLRVDNIKMYTPGHGIVFKDSTVYQNDVVFAQSASEFFIIHGDNDTIRFDMRENLYVLGIKVNDDTLFSLDSTGVLTANKFGGNVIYVGSEENFEYNTVDDAVNAASAGDVIAVLPGTYTGHIDADVANIKIIGIGGWKKTILNLTMNANAGIDVTADNVVIDGFTLSGNAAGSLILLGSHPDSVHIQNCKFKVDGAATFGLNIGTAGSDYTIVKNNLFMAGSGDGCFYGNKTITNLEMSYNEFIGQDSTSGYAIQTAGLNNAIFKGNKIHGEGHTSGGFASGIFPYCYSSAAGDSIYIEDNTISDCSKAIRLGHTSADFDLKAVFITNNTLHDNSRGVYVANDANCYPATYQLNGNVFYNNTVDIRNDYSTALAAMSNFFEGYFETDELVVLDSLRNEGTELTKGDAEFRGKVVVDDSLRSEGPVLINDKLVVDDSLRVELTSILKGDVTANGKLVIDDSLRSEGPVLINDKLVVDDSLRVELTSIQKGDATFNGKVVIDDSLRVNGTSQFNGDVTIGTAAEGDNLTVTPTAGTEIIDNFATWTPTTNWTYASSKWSHATGNATALDAGADFTPVVGTNYEVIYTLAQTVAGTGVTLSFGGNTFPTSSAAGTYTYQGIASATTTLKFTPGFGGTWVGDITACSVKALTNGNITANGITTKGQILAPFGNRTYPSYSFLNSPNSGMYYIDGGGVSFSWNGTNSFNVTSAGIYGVSGAYYGIGGTATKLYSDANYQFDFRNSTNANTLNVYGTFTSTSPAVWERTFIRSTATAGEIGTEKGAGGGSARPLNIYTDGTLQANWGTTGNLTLTTAKKFLTGTVQWTEASTDSIDGSAISANDLPVNRIAQLLPSLNVVTDANGHLTTLDSLNGAVITARTIPAKSIVASPTFITPNIGAATGTSLTLTNNASITNADADTLEITEDNTKFVGNVSTTGALTAAGVVTGESSMTLDTDATIVLTTAMCRNAIRFNADADAIDYTLPGAKKGLVVMFYDIGGGVITIDPVDGTDTIYLDGTTVGAGDAIDSPGVVGNFICLMAIDDTRWVTAGRSGTWVDGGAD